LLVGNDSVYSDTEEFGPAPSAPALAGDGDEHRTSVATIATAHAHRVSLIAATIP
jgi:hypothetical protein